MSATPGDANGNGYATRQVHSTTNGKILVVNTIATMSGGRQLGGGSPGFFSSHTPTANFNSVQGVGVPQSFT